MLITVIVMACFFLCNMHLNRKCAVLFIAVYIAYIAYSYFVFGDAT